jgi:starvation-inducible DNA-binding protein
MAKTNKEEPIVTKLSHYLADSVVLYFKLLNYHWNMVGPEFFMYHKLLEEQYIDLAEAIDLIAERIRQLGPKAPASMQEFLDLTTMKEGKATKSQDQMIEELTQDHSNIVAHCKKLIEVFQDDGDEGTADILIERMRVHDKYAWLLRSHGEKKR